MLNTDYFSRIGQLCASGMLDIGGEWVFRGFEWLLMSNPLEAASRRRPFAIEVNCGHEECRFCHGKG
jgi:hypothetical protein